MEPKEIEQKNLTDRIVESMSEAEADIYIEPISTPTPEAEVLLEPKPINPPIPRASARLKIG